VTDPLEGYVAARRRGETVEPSDRRARTLDDQLREWVAVTARHRPFYSPDGSIRFGGPDPEMEDGDAEDQEEPEEPTPEEQATWDALSDEDREAVLAGDDEAVAAWGALLAEVKG
jgi:hypothetical protein